MTKDATHNADEKHDLEQVNGERDPHAKQADAERGGETKSGENIPWTSTRIIAIAALCTVYVGSQVLLYFVSAGLVYISVDLETTLGNWMLTANTLAVAAVCPFVGYLTDLIGRRWVCIFGTILLIVGSIVMATAHNLGTAVTAMAIGGVGAGICELTAVAGYVLLLAVAYKSANKYKSGRDKPSAMARCNVVTRDLFNRPIHATSTLHGTYHSKLHMALVLLLDRAVELSWLHRAFLLLQASPAA